MRIFAILLTAFLVVSSLGLCVAAEESASSDRSGTKAISSEPVYSPQGSKAISSEPVYTPQSSRAISNEPTYTPQGSKAISSEPVYKGGEGTKGEEPTDRDRTGPRREPRRSSQR